VPSNCVILAQILVMLKTYHSHEAKMDHGLWVIWAVRTCEHFKTPLFGSIWKTWNGLAARVACFHSFKLCDFGSDLVDSAQYSLTHMKPKWAMAW
jgi:hypothetical protein